MSCRFHQHVIGGKLPPKGSMRSRRDVCPVIPYMIFFQSFPSFTQLAHFATGDLETSMRPHLPLPSVSPNTKRSQPKPFAQFSATPFICHAMRDTPFPTTPTAKCNKHPTLDFKRGFRQKLHKWTIPDE